MQSEYIRSIQHSGCSIDVALRHIDINSLRSRCQFLFCFIRQSRCIKGCLYSTLEAVRSCTSNQSSFITNAIFLPGKCLRDLFQVSRNDFDDRHTCHTIESCWFRIILIDSILRIVGICIHGTNITKHLLECRKINQSFQGCLHNTIDGIAQFRSHLFNRNTIRAGDLTIIQNETEQQPHGLIAVALFQGRVHHLAHGNS